MISYCEGGCTLQEVCLCGNNDLWEAQQALAQAVSSYTTRLREETHADIAILGQVERNERRFDKQAEIMKIRELVIVFIDKPGRASSKLRLLHAALGPICDSNLLVLVKDGTIARVHDYRSDFAGALAYYFWSGAAIVASVFTAAAIIVIGEQLLLARLCAECASLQQNMVVAGIVLLPLSTCVGLWVAIGNLSTSRENNASSRLTACSKELQKAMPAAAVGPPVAAVAGAGGAVAAAALQAPSPQVMDLLHGLRAEVQGLRDLVQIVVDGQGGGGVGAARQAAAEQQQQAAAEQQQQVAAEQQQQAAASQRAERGR